MEFARDAADALSGLVGWVEASCEWKLVVPTNAEAAGNLIRSFEESTDM